MPILWMYVAVLGLMMGSFGNVVVHRVPAGTSVITPASHCPGCGHPIRFRHNVPVLSWLVLRGRCADCSVGISARYPLVELGTALLFVAVALRLEALGELAALPAYLSFSAVAVMLSLIDLDTHRLPNSIVGPSYGVVAVLLTLAAGWQEDWGDLQRAALGAVTVSIVYLVIVLAYPAGMGWGDVKLSGLVGLVLGYLSWGAVVVGAFSGFLLGAVVGVAVIATRRGTGKTALPFGPFMFAGAFVGIFLGDPLADAYLTLLDRG